MDLNTLNQKLNLNLMGGQAMLTGGNGIDGLTMS